MMGCVTLAARATLSLSSLSLSFRGRFSCLPIPLGRPLHLRSVSSIKINQSNKSHISFINLDNFLLLPANTGVDPWPWPGMK